LQLYMPFLSLQTHTSIMGIAIHLCMWAFIVHLFICWWMLLLLRFNYLMERSRICHRTGA
jgi:hypothetical protein